MHPWSPWTELGKLTQISVTSRHSRVTTPLGVLLHEFITWEFTWGFHGPAEDISGYFRPCVGDDGGSYGVQPGSVKAPCQLQVFLLFLHAPSPADPEMVDAQRT